MTFPPRVSLTITNSCNLRCRMCGQWSENGYIRHSGNTLESMPLSEWKRIVDEMAENGVTWVLIRGGEPFLYPGIIELLDYLHEKGLHTSIDTNAMLLKQYAADLVRIGDFDFTVSVDGPEPIHDAVRGVKGSFRRIAEGLATLRELEEASGKTVARSICFTISRYSYLGLGEMPEVARQLSVPTILIVPYYYFSEAVGKEYENELRTELGCEGFSWRGFYHEDSGVNIDEFLRQLKIFKENLGAVNVFPYMDLNEDDYRTWFTDATTPVGSTECWSLDGLIDIQPNGDANFCVDFPDYSIGNVRQSTIAELWNGERAKKFRELRRKKPLAICHRCGAKYMCAPRVETH